MWGSDGRYMHDSAWWSTWQGALMIGLMLVIAGLLIWLVARSRTHPGPSSSAAPGGHDDAVAQARVRYARGELDRDAYVQLIRDLTGEPPDAASTSTPAPPTA